MPSWGRKRPNRVSPEREAEIWRELEQRISTLEATVDLILERHGYVQARVAAYHHDKEDADAGTDTH